MSGYEVITYGKFCSLIMSKYMDKDPPNLDALRDHFTNTFIWVDEAHNVSITPEMRNSKEEKVRNYKVLHKLFHTAANLKVVLSTATPMINKASELISLVNLLHPEDRCPPKDWNWRHCDLDTFRFRFPGLADIAGEHRDPCRGQTLYGTDALGSVPHTKYICLTRASLQRPVHVHQAGSGQHTDSVSG